MCNYSDLGKPLMLTGTHQHSYNRYKISNIHLKQDKMSPYIWISNSLKIHSALLIVLIVDASMIKGRDKQ